MIPNCLDVYVVIILNHYSSSNHNITTDEEVNKIGDLTDKERKDIIAFLMTLTDKEFLNDRRFTDPNYK